MLFDAGVVEHLIALIPGEGAPKWQGEDAERVDQTITDVTGAVAVGKPDQDRESCAALDQRRDRRALAGTDEEVSLPMPDLAPGLDVQGSGMDRAHVGGLLEGAGAGAAPTTTVPVGAVGAQATCGIV